MKHFIVLVFLALTVTVFCIWKSDRPAVTKSEPFARHSRPDRNREQYYAPRDYAAILHKATGAATNEAAAHALRETLTHVFDKRHEQYKANLDTLNNYLWYQLIFLAAALVRVFNKTEKLKVPVIDAEVPVRWAYRALPACLVYLWLCFGFKLNELIDSRIVLWKITEAMQATAAAFTGYGADPNVEWRRALYTFSLNPGVYDGGYMDGWFIMFRPQYTLLGQPHMMGYILMGLFGVFLGVSNGAALGLVLHGRKRFRKDFGTDERFGWMPAGYFWAAATLLGLSHLLFWYSGDHPNWQQPIIVLTACATTGWFMTRPVYGDTEEKPSGADTGDGFMMLLVNRQQIVKTGKEESDAPRRSY
jgi:hypothetical protein